MSLSSSSSVPSPQSPSNVSVLRELLEGEKENTRVWLRAEMDRLVVPLVDSIFNKLETKLINGLGGRQSGDGDSAQVVNQNFTDQQVHLSYLPSTSFTSSLPPLPYCNPHHANMDNSRPISFNRRPTCQSVSPPPVTIANVESRSMSIKHETTANEQMAEGRSPQSLSAPIVKEQSNQDLLNSDEDDEEECDSVYGIEITDEGEDVQKLSPPVKKPRLNHPTQPNKSSIIGESSRQAEAQANNQMYNQTDKQYITLSVHCPELDCLKMCAEGELNDHLKEEHSIGPSRCLVKDCAGQSFDSRRILARHIKQIHQHTTQWNCGICPKNYPTYNLLYNHDHQQHQLGQFQC